MQNAEIIYTSESWENLRKGNDFVSNLRRSEKGDELCALSLPCKFKHKTYKDLENCEILLILHKLKKFNVI